MLLVHVRNHHTHTRTHTYSHPYSSVYSSVECILYFLTVILDVLKLGVIQALSTEDAENTFLSSKKRAAEQELSRDIPLLDEEDACGLAAGTFKRVSDDILATKVFYAIPNHTLLSRESVMAFDSSYILCMLVEK